VLCVQFAMLAFEDMAKLARPGTVTELLSDSALMRLFTVLARVQRPADLLRVLTAVHGDKRPLPPDALVPIVSGGGSFITSWLPAALESARTLQEVHGVLESLKLLRPKR
jgi:hypothetical protein